MVARLDITSRLANGNAVDSVGFAHLTDGSVAVVMVQRGTEDRVLVQKLDSDLDAITMPTIEVGRPLIEEASAPIISATQDGGFAIAFQRDMEIIIARYDGTGQALPGYPAVVDAQDDAVEIAGLIDLGGGRLAVSYVEPGRNENLWIKSVDLFGNALAGSGFNERIRFATDADVVTSAPVTTEDGDLAILHTVANAQGTTLKTTLTVFLDGAANRKLELGTTPFASGIDATPALVRLENGRLLAARLESTGEVVVSMINAIGGRELNSRTIGDGTGQAFDLVALTGGTLALVIFDAAGVTVHQLNGETGAPLSDGIRVPSQDIGFVEPRGEVVALADGGLAVHREDASTGAEQVTVFLQGTAGADVTTLQRAGFFDAKDGNDIVFGSSGNDTLIGGAGVDALSGGDGDDQLFLDPISGGFSGDDGGEVARGGAGNDLIVNRAGSAFLSGGEGDDVITGSSGSETLDGGVGDDVLRARAGNDVLSGGGGNDLMRSGDGDDTLDGGRGNDILIGKTGVDSLSGGDGNDTLRGGASGDQLDGGAGRDVLRGGAGEDVLTGGAGKDSFIFRSDDGALAEEVDTITDFTSGSDKIRLRGFDDIKDFGDLDVLTSAGTAQVEFAGRVLQISLTNGALSAQDFDIA